MKLQLVLAFLCLVVACYGNASQKRLPLINVHVIAHTHDDVGWLKTVDGYYYGANTSIQEAGVQYILDTVIDELLADESKKFIYVEIAFFIRWWREQSEFKKQIVRDLVAAGRLEFINGGWCMNDEATTHYSAIIEQMTEGHDFLFKEFGVRPRIGWHIDPFGHASTQASLFAQMGFDAFFFGRIDYGEHALRNATQQLEFVWRGSKSLGKATEIWTHVLYTDYCFLSGTAWDYGDTPIMDDPLLFDMNIKEKSDNYAAQIRQRALGFRTNNILAPLGCDFAFQNAHLTFKNMDKMIKYINSRPEYGLNLFYSTPSIYMKAVYNTGLTWSVKTGDFFPYADDPHSYWTGFYTSRSAIKGYVRSRNAFLHATDKLFTTSNVPSVVTRDNLGKIDALAQAFSVAQHHDAVSGTEQQHVADDYAKRLSIGTVAAEQVVSEVLGKIINPNTPPSFSFCPLLNESICPPLDALKQGAVIPIVVYNSVAWVRNTPARLPIPIQGVQVLNSSGKVVPSQVFPNADRPGYFTLVFKVSLPPMGFATYFLQMSKDIEVVPIETEAANIVLENEFLRATIDSNSGRLSSIYNKKNLQTLQISQDFLWWNGSAGNNNQSQQASGAYIFRPNGTTPFPINSNPVSVSFVNGPIVQEVYQTWNSWTKQVIRLYAGESHLELEATVGPIDISDKFGKEVISRFSTNLNTKGLFYTDSEGMEFEKRTRNYRPWPYNITEPIASNYYPMNQAAYINDQNQSLQLTVLTDRSRGVASLTDGQLENMVHRRLLFDDSRGVGEPLNESNIVRTIEQLIVEKPSLSARLHRPKSLNLNNPILLAFSSTSSVSSWIQSSKTIFSPMSAALPHNVHLLNLKTREDGFVLLRLTHLYEVNEDHEFSRPATVDLNTLFPGLQIVTATEMTLTANQPLSELQRLNWKTSSATTTGEQERSILMNDFEDFQVTINPMDTRTFLIRYQPTMKGHMSIN